jgi:RNA polymerase sigma factor (sigma-70 family)
MLVHEDHPPDSDLVRLASEGDEAAFSELFDRYFDRIRTFAYRIVLNHENATDIAQESFIKAARQIRTLRDGQSFQSWIYKICSNSSRDHLRSTKTVYRPSSLDLPGTMREIKDCAASYIVNAVPPMTWQNNPSGQRLLLDLLNQTKP